MSELEKQVMRWLADYQYQIISVNQSISGIDPYVIPIHAKAPNGEHIWIEVKDNKRSINKRDVQALHSRFVQIEKEYHDGARAWCFQQVFVVSRKGFSDNAVAWANQFGIHCLELSPDGQVVPSRGGQGSYASRAPSDSFSQSPPQASSGRFSAFSSAYLSLLERRNLLLYLALGMVFTFLVVFLLTTKLSKPNPAINKHSSHERNIRKHSSIGERKSVKRQDLVSHRLWKEASLAVKQNNFSRAAKLYKQMQSVSFPLVPTWHLQANEAWALAQVRQFLRGNELLQKAENSYKQWKRSLWRNGGKLTYYMRLTSHKVFARAHWHLAKSGSMTARLRHLGAVWLLYVYSPLSGKAEPLWWRKVRTASVSLRPSHSFLYKAARRYASHPYRQYNKAEALLSMISLRSRFWRRRVEMKRMDIAFARKRWAQVLQLSSRFLYRYNRRSDKRLRHRAMRLNAIASYHRFGRKSFELALARIPSYAMKERLKAYYAVAVEQLETGKDLQSIQSFSFLAARSKGWEKLAALWFLGLLNYKQKNNAKAIDYWSRARLYTSSSAWKIRLSYWLSKAALNNGLRSLAKTHTNYLCQKYPMNYYSLLFCPSKGMISTFPRKDSIRWAPSVFLRNRLNSLSSTERCRELDRQIWQEPKPGAGLVLEAARCFSRTGQWKKSYHLFAGYRIASLWKGELSKETAKAFFPRPGHIWPLLQKVSKKKDVPLLLAASIMLRESNFTSERSYAARVGLMGVDSTWSHITPLEPRRNIAIGLERIRNLIRRFGLLVGVSAYRGIEADVYKSKIAHPGLAEELLLETGPNKAWLYARGPRNGVHWYYLMYKKLYGTSL
jgi:hypothetical protein